jgi:pantothenate kinase type III
LDDRIGAPVVVVDFGTAVTFDVVDAQGDYVGGIIAPGLAAMTDYLHEKTALLPRIKIREAHRMVGKSTEQAMLIGAVRGYRGLIRELIAGQISMAQCVERIQQSTRRYAKRQLTWFRRQSSFEALNLSPLSHAAAVDWITARASSALSRRDV